MKVYIVRHPETTHNENNRLTGWEETDYSNEGKIQFKKIVSFFNGSNFKVYSSDLSRASDLAKAIAKKNNTSLVITDILRERNFRETKPLDSNETVSMFTKRVKSFLKDYNLSDSILVTHSGVANILAKIMLNVKTIPELNCPRDNIFMIERNKKAVKLSVIEV